MLFKIMIACNTHFIQNVMQNVEFLVLKQVIRRRDYWGDLGIDGWIIVGWICRRWDVGVWTALGWPRIETGGGRL